MRTPVLRSPAVLLGVPAVAVAALGVGSMVGGVTPTADHFADPGRPDAASTQRVPGAQAAPPLAAAVPAVPAAVPVVPLAPVSTVSTVDDDAATHPGGGAVESVASKGDDAAPAHAGHMFTFDRGAPAPARHVAAPAAPATSDAAVSRTAPAAAAPVAAPLARHAAAPAAPAAAAEPRADDAGGGSLLAVSTPVVGLSVLSFG